MVFFVFQTKTSDIEVELNHEQLSANELVDEAGKQNTNEQTEHIKQEDESDPQKQKDDQKKPKKKKAVVTRKRRSRYRKTDTEESETNQEEKVQQKDEPIPAVTADDGIQTATTIDDSVMQNDTKVLRLTSLDMTVVGLLCSYLQICPYGATTEQVVSHMQRHIPSVLPQRLEELLDGLPMLFSGDGLEFYNKTWTFKNIFS